MKRTFQKLMIYFTKRSINIFNKKISKWNISVFNINTEFENKNCNLLSHYNSTMRYIGSTNFNRYDTDLGNVRTWNFRKCKHMGNVYINVYKNYIK